MFCHLKDLGLGGYTGSCCMMVLKNHIEIMNHGHDHGTLL